MLRRALSETPSHAGILSYHPSKHKLVPLGGALLGIFFILVPACVRWMILGAVLASAAILTYLWLNTRHTRQEPIIVPDLASLPPLRVPEIRPSGTGDAQLTVRYISTHKGKSLAYLTHFKYCVLFPIYCIYVYDFIVHECFQYHCCVKCNLK